MRKRLSGFHRRVVAAASLVACLAAESGIAWGEDPPIPGLSRWERQMKTYGERHCASLARLSGDDGIAATFYDMIRVMYQIADYTGDAGCKPCALRARDVYRDAYVLKHKGQVPGYWNFTTGLRMDAERTGHIQSRQAVVLLSQQAAYSADSTPFEWTRSGGRSREVAFAIIGYIMSGGWGPRRGRTAPERANVAYAQQRALVSP